MTDDQYDFESIAVGAGEERPQADTKDVVTPIHLSATFGLDSAGYPEEGYTYTRHSNPTRDRLEDRLADLSNAARVFAASSGMATVSTVCLSLLSPGDRVVAADSLFGGTKQLFDEFLTGFGVEVSYVDATDPENVADALGPSAELVWMESPTNPLLKLCDIEAVGELTEEHGATLVVDNTFATPYAQRPLDLGADVSVLSTTKFVNGHTDSVGGAIAVGDADLAEQFGFVLRDVLGAPLSPFDSYLVARGLKTLPARMESHQRNATEVAAFLADHESVAAVNYPGLQSHPDHDLAARQMDNYGGVVTFELDGDGAETRAFVEELDVFELAMSLGGVESLVEHTASMSAASLSPAERETAGISDSLVRLSVGLESPDDLIPDLAAALDEV
ncbi:PLP-dependent aspartate aminotransferase family protein [Halorussus sp. MSC15.2]|uniref:trans-sulfuration enzyme family protein n=1 Tax=Halorussus sp. MSC15.2 TaxID=2283638 RepID=UPI0013D81CA5|nr:PLP-dependent aspartate aminotransferase family protein [Halorussus sp. MSC15.2]NEU56434.1 PLP-dependent transferase [Halorussus sp. MSC15.2]